MVYVTGMISDLLMPFAFTISYALIASLIVAMTVVPTISATVLKTTKTKQHKLYDKVNNYYGKVLEKCLKHKAIPLIISVLLLVICVVQAFRMGLVMMDDMVSNQISVSLTVDDDTEKKEAYATADKVMDAILKVKGIDKVGAMDGNAGATSSVLGGAGGNYTSFTFSVITDEDIKTTGQFKKIIKEIEDNAKDIKCKELKVSSSALGDTSSLSGNGLQVNIYGDDQNKLVSISKDVKKMMEDIKGTENVKDGISEKNKQIHLEINKDKAAECGLTTAQIYQQLAAKIKTDKTAVTITVDNKDMDVNVINDLDKPDVENLMNTEITSTTKNASGEDVNKTYKLSKFAKMIKGESVDSIRRENQSRYMSVTAEVKEDYNATLLSRQLEKSLAKYDTPVSYTHLTLPTT